MTDRYCVIGNPIAHSKSPRIHAQYAAELGEDLLYEQCLAPVDGFAATVARLVGEGCKGANVTVPFKLEAARLATRLTARAQAAGAVNTLVFDGGEIVGDNTDGVGLVADIVRRSAPYGAFPANMRTKGKDDLWEVFTRFQFTREDSLRATLGNASP